MATRKQGWLPTKNSYGSWLLKKVAGDQRKILRGQLATKKCCWLPKKNPSSKLATKKFSGVEPCVCMHAYMHPSTHGTCTHARTHAGTHTHTHTHTHPPTVGSSDDAFLVCHACCIYGNCIFLERGWPAVGTNCLTGRCSIWGHWTAVFSHSPTYTRLNINHSSIAQYRGFS